MFVCFIPVDLLTFLLFFSLLVSFVPASEGEQIKPNKNQSNPDVGK
jgi:hypothetical protein